MTTVSIGRRENERRRIFSRLPSLDHAVTIFALLLTLALILAPVGYLYFGSLRTDVPGAPEAGFTFAKWIKVYTAADYHSALVSTVMLAVTVGALAVALGGMLAWVVVRTDAPGRGKLALLLVVPLMISNLITALAWVALAAPNAGFINAGARALFGIRTVFDVYSFGGIVLVLTLHYASLAYIALYAALRSIDSTLEEASFMLGAGPFATAAKMTLPLVWPTIIASFLIIVVFVSENFSVPILLGGQVRFNTIASQIYFEMTNDPGDPTMAAAAGTLLVWIALVGTWWQRRVLQRAHRFVTIGGKGGRSRITELGRWRYVVTGLVVFYLLLAVGFPYLALILTSFLKFVTPRIHWASFTLDNYAHVLRSDSILPLSNSLLLSGVGGFAAALFYLFVAHGIRQSRNWLGELVGHAVVIPTVIPALVLGVGFVWAFVAFPIPIYGTIWILFIAYLTRFMGQGVQQARAAFVQVSDELVDAARIAGATPLRAFKDVLLPLLRPAVVSLWTVLFILIFMEISATIVLYAPRTMTLPVLLWDNMERGYQTRAFAVAVVQATIVFAVLFVGDRLFGTLRKTLET